MSTRAHLLSLVKMRMEKISVSRSAVAAQSAKGVFAVPITRKECITEGLSKAAVANEAHGVIVGMTHLMCILGTKWNDIRRR